MAQIAQDTFIAQQKDGSERLVVKGEAFPDNHELVRNDKSHTLFRPLDLGENDLPPKQPKATARKPAV
jgi:hypothetical protein